MPSFDTLVGHTIERVEGMEVDSERVILHVADGPPFSMYHERECCEAVRLAEVVGDVDDLLNTPVLTAEESTNSDNQPDAATACGDSWMWTFYRVQTIKGLVVLRWLGESNGYYSEGVTFYRQGDNPWED